MIEGSARQRLRRVGVSCLVRRLLAAVVLALALLVLAACSQAEPYPKVMLSTEKPTTSALDAAPQKVPLGVAVAPVISPRESFKLYAPLLDYIARRIDRPVQAIQRRTYGEINELVRYGQADVAFVCDYAFVEGERTFGMQSLVAPVVQGKNTYQSYIIVPRGSVARSLFDLRGSAFAFSDPLSSSGWLYPTHLLREAGERPDSFFKRHVFTFSHDKTVQAVADRLVDGGAVDSLVYEYLLANDPRYGQDTTVIQQSEPWGTPPVVVHPRIDPELRAQLRQVFLTMHEDPQARSILAPLMIDRFALPDDAAYDPVRRMAALAAAQR